jgi:hypothetical protein
VNRIMYWPCSDQSATSAIRVWKALDLRTSICKKLNGLRGYRHWAIWYKNLTRLSSPTPEPSFYTCNFLTISIP